MSPTLEFRPSSLNFQRPFTNDPASAQLQIINRSTSWIVYFVSCISTSGLEYSTRPLYLTLAPGYHIKQKVTRSVVLRDPPARYRQDIACIESIVLEGEPDKSWASKDLWEQRRARGDHISSWIVPINLLPTLPSDIPPGALTTVHEGRPNQVDYHPLRSDTWTRFQPTVGSQDDGYFRLLYQTPSNSRSATIHQCIVKYGDKGVIEPAKVAVKVLRDKHDNSHHLDHVGPRSIIQRAKAEVTVWKDLEHPNVAPLLGICFYPRICFVTPFYVNGNVVDFVKQSGAHGERKYTLMQDVILGLRYLHSKRIIHGDLKYDNVMVDHNSSGKIIDFGLAMTTQQAFGAITKAGVDRYTPSAAASSGKKAFVTDLYALGFILLEIALGATADQKALDDPVPKRSQYPGVPGYSPLWEVMEYCWGSAGDLPNVDVCHQKFGAIRSSQIELPSPEVDT